MDTLELELPWPPTVNHYKSVGKLVRTKTGKLYQQRHNSDATKQFYWQVWSIIVALRTHKGLKSFHDATISMEIHAYPPDKRKRDLDGILKVLLDALQRAGVYDDDFQIARLYVERKNTIAEGKVIVRIEELKL